MRLWDEVPQSERVQQRGYGWYGCPYAVKGWMDQGWRRCAGSVPSGSTICPAHDPDRRRVIPDAVAVRVRRLIQNEEQRRRFGVKRVLPLVWFRALSDDDFQNMHMVGVKMLQRMCEIRDSWDDEAVLAFFEFPKRPQQVTLSPEDFWLKRHDMLSLMGG